MEGASTNFGDAPRCTACLLADSGMKVSLPHGPTPRDEPGYQLAVAAVGDAEALPEFAFFQGQLESELEKVEGSKQHESPAASEQPCTQEQAEVRVI